MAPGRSARRLEPAPRRARVRDRGRLRRRERRARVGGGKDQRQEADRRLDDDLRARVQGKLMWDIAEVQVPSGGDVRYWIEAKDNDIDRRSEHRQARASSTCASSARASATRRRSSASSRSPRRSSRTSAAGSSGPADDSPRARSSRTQLRDAIVELALDRRGVRQGSARQRSAAQGARADARSARPARDDRAEAVAEGRVRRRRRAAFAGIDPRLVAELEDDTMTLADWLDRERMEGLLDIADEIAAHQKRLADLLAQYARTKDPRLLDEIEREMRALDRGSTRAREAPPGHARGRARSVRQPRRRAGQTSTTCIDEVARADARRQGRRRRRPSSRSASSSRTSGASALERLAGVAARRQVRRRAEEARRGDERARRRREGSGRHRRRGEPASSSRTREKADEVARDHRREASEEGRRARRQAAQAARRDQRERA